MTAAYPASIGNLLMATILKLLQYLLRPMQHRFGQSGQLGHVNAVATISATGNDFPQEDHSTSLLGDCYVAVLHPRQILSQFH